MKLKLSTYFSIRTLLTDCDMIRSRTSCEVAEEVKENWLETVALSSSSVSPFISSGIEVVVQEELLADFGTVLVLLTEWWWWWWGGARALDTSRAETLHDLERYSIGPLGLSGSCVPWRERWEMCSGRRRVLGLASSMKWSWKYWKWALVLVLVFRL